VLVIKKKMLSVLVLVLALAPVTATLAPTTAEAQSAVTAEYVGDDGDWFDASNWSTGRVPDAATDVVISAGAHVVIDPARSGRRGGVRVAVGDLNVEEGAELETLPGTIFEVQSEHVASGGQLTFRSSGVIGDSLAFDPPQCTTPAECALEPLSGWTLNPTPKQKRIIVLQSSVTTTIGLGGLAPASLTSDGNGELRLAAGPGHYATATAEDLAIAGQLTVKLHYGFSPASGDTFQILRGTRSFSGEFDGLPEGGLVGCTADDVGLYVSYRNGGVELAARDTAPATCLLVPAINAAREAGRRSSR
jgi:hypothetical protein